MKIPRIARVIIGLLALAAPLRAQQSIALTVEEAIRLAFDKSKTLHASMMKVQYADAKSSETGTLLLPSLKFGGVYTRLSSVPSFEVSLPLPTPTKFVLSPAILDNYNIRVSLQQPIFTGWKVQSAVDMAKYSAQATQKDYDKDKNDLVYYTRVAYWNLSKAIELENVVNETVEQIRTHLKDVQNMQAQGLLTNNDVLKVQVQLSEAQLRQIDARNGVRLARIGLNNTIGIPLDTEVQLKSILTHQSMEFPPLPKLVEDAIARRAEIGGMEYRVKAGQAGVTQAQSNWFPQVYVTGNYYFNRPNQRLQPIQDAFKDTWDVGLGVSFDIWNWGTAVHQTDQAKAQLAQAQDGLGQLRDAITLDVTSNYLNMQRAAERISVAEQGVKQAEENYRVTTGRFKQGLTTNTEVLDAEVALLQAKTNFTQSLTDYELAEAGLTRAVGLEHEINR
jgi:outer membrane protein